MKYPKNILTLSAYNNGCNCFAKGLTIDANPFDFYLEYDLFSAWELGFSNGEKYIENFLQFYKTVICDIRN